MSFFFIGHYWQLREPQEALEWPGTTFRMQGYQDRHPGVFRRTWWAQVVSFGSGLRKFGIS